MKRVQLKYLRNVGLFAIVLALITLISTVWGNGVVDASEIIAAAIPAATVSTESITESSPDLLLNDIDKQIVEIEPSSAPLDTLIRKVSQRSINKSLEVEYYSVDFKGVLDTVATGGGITANNQESFDLKVNNPDMWGEGDGVCVVGVKAYTDADNTVIPMADLLLHVFEVDRSNGVLKCQPVNGYKLTGKYVLHTGDDIAEATQLRRMGRAASESQIQTDPYADMPLKDVNYMQKFIAQIEETTWAKIHNKEVDWSFDDYSRRMISNMRIDKELSYLFQTKRKIISKKDGKPRYITGGAAEFVNNETDLTSTTLTNAVWQGFTREIFQGNSGSDQRFMLCGDLAIQAIGEIDDVQAQTRNKKRETMFGLTFNRINTNFGELLLIKHDLFGLVGAGNKALVVDMEYLHERHFEPTRTINLDLRTSGQSDADSKVIIETACPLWKYPDVHRWATFKMPS